MPYASFLASGKLPHGTWQSDIFGGFSFLVNFMPFVSICPIEVVGAIVVVVVLITSMLFIVFDIFCGHVDLATYALIDSEING